MNTEAQILANYFITNLFMNSVNWCKSVSEKYNQPRLPNLPKLLSLAECDFAKQTQFSKNQNEPKPLFRNDLRGKMPPPTTRKTNPIKPKSHPHQSSIRIDTFPATV